MSQIQYNLAYLELAFTIKFLKKHSHALKLLNYTASILL